MRKGFLRIRVLENSEITLEKLQDDMKVNMELTGVKKCSVLYDARPHFLITVEAREFLQQQAFNEGRIATAVLTNKLGVRLMVNFMTRVRKTKSPIRLFTNEKGALECLRSFENPELNYTS